MPRASQIEGFYDEGSAGKPRQERERREEPEPQFEQEIESGTSFELPDVTQWDYQNAITGPRGEDLPEGAQQWKPDGKPFFGEGLQGKLKEYWWNFTKDVPHMASAREMSDLASQSKKFREDYGPYAPGNVAAQQMGANVKEALGSTGDLNEEEQAELDELSSRQRSGGIGLTKEENARFRELSKQGEGSLISGFRRGVNVGVQAGMDLFNVSAEGVEQGVGAYRGAAEQLAEQTGSDVDFEGAAQRRAQRQDEYMAAVRSGEINPNAQRPSIDWQEAKENLRVNLATSPPAVAYNSLRVALSPSNGNFSTVKERMEEGWDSGRILYTSMIDPMIRYEYERRLAQGENPELLAMELENPWAEMAGQMLLDPLNLIGAVGKGAKYAGKLDESIDMARAMATPANASFDEAVEAFAKVSTDAGAQRVVDDFVSAQMEAVKAREAARTQKYGLFELTASSQRGRLKRDVSDFFGVTVDSMIKDGRSADDIAQMFKFGVMSVSDNMDEAAKGTMGLMNASVPEYFFSEMGIDSMSTVRKLLVDADGAVNPNRLMNAIKSDDPITALGKIVDDAAGLRMPTVEKMEQAAKKVAEGKGVSADTLKLAEQYRQVPEHVKWFSKTVKPMEKTKNFVNKFLGQFYFTYNPGTAIRNQLSNTLFMMADEGVGTFFDSGVYKGMQQVDDDLVKMFGYMPEEAGAITFSEMVGNKAGLMQRGEAAASKRILLKRSKDAFERIIETALPYDDVLKQAGMSEQQFGLFKHLVKKEGSIQDATKAFNEMAGTGGMDAWRSLDFLPDEYVRGLKENGGLWDDLLDFARNPDASLDDLDNFIDGKIQAYTDAAAKAADDVPGMAFNHASSDSFGKMFDAKKAGYIPEDEMTKVAMYEEAASQAKAEYLQQLEKVVKSPQLQNANPEELTSIIQRLAELKPNEHKAATQVKKSTDAMIDAAWETTRKVKGGNVDELPRAWKRFGLEGQPPADDPLGAFWTTIREKRGAMWEEHFNSTFDEAEVLIDSLKSTGLDTNDLDNSFARARGLDQQAQQIKTAQFSKGKAYKSVEPVPIAEVGTTENANNIRTLANQYGMPSTTKKGTPNDKHILNTVNKFYDVEPTKIPLGDVKDVPRGELPNYTSQRMADEARRMLDDMFAGQPGKRATSPKQLGEGATEAFGTTNINWYRELPPNMQKKPVLDKALNKIIEDAGKDKGVNVERLKDMIIDRFTYGDAALGQPPDLGVLKELGAPRKTLQEALDNYNAITKQKLSLGDALKQSGYKPAGFNKLDDIPQELAEAAFAQRGTPKEVIPKGDPIIPPFVPDGGASIPRQMLENQKGMTEALEFTRNAIKDRWGQVIPTSPLSPQLAEYGAQYGNRIAEAKMIALKNAEYWRDFTLLGYGTDKTYADLASQYLMPYSFWYSGTYKNMLDRVVTNPEVLAAYAKYREASIQQHKFSPEWYRQQVKVDNIFGVDIKDPLVFNLEATLWPLNGLTGPDFKDRSKRVNWWTSTLDDLGSFGPAIWAPVQMAVAASFAMQGEEDTALRWAGRMMPQSPAIKAISSLVTGTPIETDPSVLLFGGDKPFDFTGAMDAYELGRVPRALADVMQEEIDDIMGNQDMTSEQKKMMIANIKAHYMDVAHSHDGPEWQEAYRRATNLRAPGQITSPLLGVGFKARTNTDIEIDEMYSQMSHLFAMSDGMTGEQYKQAWESFRETFPYSDMVLLARKGGDLRDGAFSYNVLSRIPPGKTDDVFRTLHIDDLSEKFYESKGDFSGWSKQDKDRFMAGILDAAAILAVPDGATRQEWTDAKLEYQNVFLDIEEDFGEDIWEKVDTYYGLRDKDYQLGREFLEAFPEVQDALNAKSAMIAETPELYKYYGSLQTISSYYESNLRNELGEKHGEDIFEIAGTYHALPKYNEDGEPSEERKQWRRENPEQYERLREYWDDYYSEGTERNVDNAVIRLAEMMPDAGAPLLRGEPTGAAQEAVANIFGEQEQEQEVLSSITPTMQEVISRYLAGGELPQSARDKLDSIGEDYNMDANDIIRLYGAR